MKSTNTTHSFSSMSEPLGMGPSVICILDARGTLTQCREAWASPLITDFFTPTITLAHNTQYAHRSLQLAPWRQNVQSYIPGGSMCESQLKPHSKERFHLFQKHRLTDSAAEKAHDPFYTKDPAVSSPLQTPVLPMLSNKGQQ